MMEAEESRERAVLALERIAVALEGRNKPYIPTPEEVEHNRAETEKFEQQLDAEKMRQSEVLVTIFTSGLKYFGFKISPGEEKKNG